MPNGMVERDHPDLSIGRQCALLQVPRSSFYYTPQDETDQNLASPWTSNQWRPHGSLRLIDVRFLDTPFLGVRQMTWHLRSCRDRGPSGAAQARKRPQGERKAHTSAYAPYGSDADPPEAQHQPADEGTQDLPLSGSRGLRVARPNQVWCVDITYLPMRRGARHGLGPVAAHASLSLVAIMDWHTRMVLAWRISNIEPWSATGPRTMARGRRLLRRGAERGHLSVRTAGHHDHGAWSRHRSKRPCDVKGPTSRRLPGQTACDGRASASRWMAKAFASAPSTTSSSSVCGAP